MKSPINQLIYIVDDSASYGEFLRLLFIREGHDVKFFENVGSFFDALINKLPNLVITDIEIPHVDGFDLYDKMKDNYPETVQIPFIFMTSLETSTKIERAKARSIYPVFEKSISIVPLIKLVNKILLDQPSLNRQVNH